MYIISATGIPKPLYRFEPILSTAMKSYRYRCVLSRQHTSIPTKASR